MPARVYLKIYLTFCYKLSDFQSDVPLSLCNGLKRTQFRKLCGDIIIREAILKRSKISTREYDCVLLFWYISLQKPNPIGSVVFIYLTAKHTNTHTDTTSTYILVWLQIAVLGTQSLDTSRSNKLLSWTDRDLDHFRSLDVHPKNANPNIQYVILSSPVF